MNNLVLKSFLGIGILATGISSCSDGSKPSKPNIIYILADDLGYGELGCYGQTKIETPNIDKLAADGMLFTQHYSGSPVSAPSRSVLLTGLHSGKTQIRSNDEWDERGNVWDFYAMHADSSLEGQRPLEKGTVTLGTVLQSAGYKTAIVGKWGLGAPHTDGVPNKLGFDFFFGYNCQRQAHTYYPFYLWKNDRRVYLNNDTIPPPRRKLPEGADPYDPASYAVYQQNDYSPDLMFEEITQFVDENKDHLFFLYWATPIPHLPLQVPQDWIDYYIKKFGDEEPFIKGDYYYPHRYPRAAYAAMVSYLDDQTGKLVQQLKNLGIYENTLIIFTSDNGPSYLGGTDSPWFNSGGPFRCEYGFGKGFLHEGGIRVPMIASWPAVIKAGQVTHHISAFWDIMPTLSEIAGVEIPDFTDGISFVPTLKGGNQKEHEFLYWEFPSYGGQIAVRIGNMKALLKDIHRGNQRWELYDLDKDPGETKNLVSEHPELIEKVNNIIRQEHVVSLHEPWRFKFLGE